jgi:hypothetical protein
MGQCHDKPFVQVQVNNKTQYIGKKRFKSFKTMDDLIRHLHVVEPMQFYKMSAHGKDIPFHSPIRIYKEIDLQYTNFYGFHYIVIRCSPLYKRYN